MNDDRLENLLIRQEITGVLMRYCRGIDRLDEDVVRSCYHPDAIDNHGLYDGTVDEFVNNAFTRQSKVAVAQHTVHNILIEIDGRQAVAETYGSAIERTIDDAGQITDMCVGFRYLDRFESRDDGPWLIAKRTLVVDWARIVTADEGWLGGVQLVRGARNKDDLLYAELASLRGAGQP